MNLDPRTIVILTVLSTLLMSIGLFVVARGYLAEMRGVTRWAAGTLLQSVGWIFLALTGSVPAYISEIGSPIIMLAMALYYHALVSFKDVNSRIYWVYIVVAINLVAIYYFLLVVPDMSVRIVIASSTAALLMMASTRVLLFENANKRPVSHTMTGSLFALCSVVLVVRAFYYLIWNTSPDQSAFEHNIVQDVAFLTFFVAAVVSPFTYILMCNDLYNTNARLRTQELAEKNAELEEMSRVKGQFLATMSHELRTPLNGVIGFLNQLGKTRLDEQQRDYLRTIDLSSRMLLGVINDILDFSKIDAGKLTIENAEFDLGDFLGETVSMFAVSAKEKGIDLVCKIDQTVPLNLMGDTLRLSQVLSNLLGNAIKFTEKGQVKLEVNLVAETDREVSLQLVVSDTGIGISEHALAKLFQPFSQADASTTRKHGGTGLGLIIARRLIEMMGGTIGVTSKVWIGTSFTIHLTLAKQDRVLTGSPERLELSGSKSKIDSMSVQGTINLKPLKGKRVLVVDDNHINRKLGPLLIAELGGEFELAENGVQAVDACSRREFDLILMDVNMPVMDGLEATQRIRALESSSHRTPIFALTANALPGDRERFIAAGMDDYLSKPLNEKALLNMLNKWFPQDVTLPVNNDHVERTHDNETPVLDPKLGVELSFGEAETWHMVLSLMLDDLADFSEKLDQFSGDMQQLIYWSHKLAGSSCYCGTPVLYQAAKQLEIYCTQGDVLAVPDSLSYLQQQIDRMRKLDAEGKLRGSKITVY